MQAAPEGADGTGQVFFPQRDYDPIPSEHAFPVTCRDGTSLVNFSIPLGVPSGLTMLYFHGNGEVTSKASLRSQIDGLPNLMDFLEDCPCLARVVMMEYRGYGASQGDPTISTLLTDAEDVLEALKLPAERVVLFGRSIGTIPAVHLAGRFPSMAALIVDSGMSNPLEYVHGRANGLSLDEFRSSRVGQQLSMHKQHLSVFNGRLLILHTADDDVFDWSENADRMFEWACADQAACAAEQKNATLQTADSAPCTVQSRATAAGVCRLCVKFEYGGHNFIWPLNWKAYAACLRALLDRSNNELGMSGVVVDGSWWERRHRILNGQNMPKDKGKCSGLCVIS